MKESLRTIKTMAGSKKHFLKTLDYQPVALGTKSLPDENKLDLKPPTRLEQ